MPQEAPLSSRRSEPVRRHGWLSWVVIVVVGGLIAVKILADGWSSEMVEHRYPDAAIDFHPRNAGALTLAAHAAYNAGRSDEAISDARAALLVDPMSFTALRILGLAYAERGDQTRALAFLSQSARLSWRDTPTQFWLLQHAALAGDPEQLATRGDALLRRRELGDRVFAIFRAMLAVPEGRKVLTEHLLDMPSWRSDFLQSLQPSNDAESDAFVNFFAELQQSGAHISEAESTPLLARMINLGEGRIAGQLWALLDPDKKDAPPIDDPNFEAIGQNSGAAATRAPFRWLSLPNSDVQIGNDVAPDGKPALSITSDGSGAHNFVIRYLTLEPGDYVMTFSTLADPTQAGGRLNGSIGCIVPDRPLATSPGRGGSGWQTVTTAFRVDASCQAQIVSFSLDSADQERSELFLRGVEIDSQQLEGAEN